MEAVIAIGLPLGLLVIVHDGWRATTRRAAERRKAAPWCCRRRSPSACRSQSRRPYSVLEQRCTWLSMPPGITNSPEASISRAAFEAVGDRRDLAAAHADVGPEPCQTPSPPRRPGSRVRIRSSIIPLRSSCRGIGVTVGDRKWDWRRAFVAAVADRGRRGQRPRLQSGEPVRALKSPPPLTPQPRSRESLLQHRPTRRQPRPKTL